MVRIFVEGYLETTSVLTSEQRAYIRAIENGYECDAFDVEGDGLISLKLEECEGSNPIVDYIEKPLKDLVAYLKSQNITLSEDGYFEVSSDWGDYDDITITISPDLEITYENTEVINAKTETLIKELEKRGFKVVAA